MIPNPQTQNRLPNGWRWVKLEDVVIPYNGYWGQETPVPNSTEVIVLGVGNISNDGRINLDEAQHRYLAPNESEAIAREGDLLVVKSSGSASNIRSGKTGLCTAELDGKIACSNFMIRLIVQREQADPYLLWLILNSNDAKSFIRLIAGSTTYPNIKWSSYKEFSFLLPSLPEQQRIAAILTEQMAAVEQARAAAEARLEAAKTLPAAYLRATFNDAKAQWWSKKLLGEVCQLLPSKSIATNGDTSVQAITTACLTETAFRPSGVKQARMWASDAAECIVSPGEILIARSNTPDLVGRAAMFAGDPKGAVASDLTVRIWPADSVSSPFLAAYLSFLYVSGYWKERAGGASGSMKKITRSQIANEKIPVPTLPEQRCIAAILNEQMAAMGQARKALEAELSVINALPAALLREAFAGRL